MFTRVAVLPQPPLLVPELVGGGDRDADLVRESCLAVARRLAAAARSWVAVGTGAAAVFGPELTGTFADFGVDVRVALGGADPATPPEPELPLPALVAGWLRGVAGADEVRVHLVPADLSVDECRGLGAKLAAAASGTGLLVLGDGSHRHGERAVGRPDERAGAFDAAVADALAAADPEALLAVDTGLARELGAAGRAPWQVLAGAAEESGPWRCVGQRLLVPFGVGYHIAEWEPVR